MKRAVRLSAKLSSPLLPKHLLVSNKVTGMLPHLHDESEIKEAFSRMDHNGDGVVDLTDFLMWEERMQEGRANTDFYALQEVLRDRELE